MAVNIGDVHDLLVRWLPVLRLADWDIDTRIVRSSWRKGGDIKVDLDDRKAVLLINESISPAELEETVVHELIHLRLYGLDRMLVDLLTAGFGPDVEEPRRAFAEDRFMTLLESTTEDLTKAVLTAAGIETPLSFKRLLPEVEREIGRAASDG